MYQYACTSTYLRMSRSYIHTHIHMLSHTAACKYSTDVHDWALEKHSFPSISLSPTNAARPCVGGGTCTCMCYVWVPLSICMFYVWIYIYIYIVLYMNIYIKKYIYIHIHIHICIHIYIYIYIYKHTHTQTHTYIYIYVCVYVCMHVVCVREYLYKLYLY